MTTIVSDGEFFTGSDSSDSVVVLANGVVVQGGGGNDWLTTQLSLASDATSTELRGGSGNDRLHATMLVEGVLASVLLVGGTGNDALWVNFVGQETDWAADLSGGDGDDEIHVSTDYPDPGNGYPEKSISAAVDAGDGDDDISIELWGGGDFAERGDDRLPTGISSTVFGGDGADRIHATTSSGSGSAINEIHGGIGDDSIDATNGFGSEWNVGRALTRVFGDEGNDTISIVGWGAGAVNFADGGEGDDIISLKAHVGYLDADPASQEARGGVGNDDITAEIDLSGRAADWLIVVNKLYGDDGDDRLSATIKADDLGAGIIHSELHGGNGNDSVKASGGVDNILYGNQGNDTLLGSGNADRLIGGAGADFLRGNGGDDTFEFWGARGLSAKERDRIYDFTIGEDLIDVSRIDANAFRSGNQAFRFSSEGEWQGTGRIWVEDNPDNDGSIVYASTGRKMLAIKMLAINLLDGTGVDASDYSAGDFIL